MAEYKECCVKGFDWAGTPNGRETKLADNNTYISGSNPDVAILVVHDALGWTFTNTRILADHYAKEVGATVYLPDFFGGKVLPSDIVRDPSRWGEIDFPGFMAANTPDIRRPEVFACTKALRGRYKRVAAIGFCFGGWAVFDLGAEGNNLVDCISTGHPTFLTEAAIGKVRVPVQILAPERDPLFTQELKDHSNKVIPTLGVPYDYQFFPGVEHGFCTRGNPGDIAERKAMIRAKEAAVSWMKQWLYEHEVAV